MSHPSVVTLGAKRAPRRLVCGEELREVDLPPGTRVVYPRAPMQGSVAPERDIRQALDEPLGSEPLSALLRPETKLVIALEGLYHGPDAVYEFAGLALASVVDMARNNGVQHIDIVLATGIHRRLFPGERKLLLHAIDTNGVSVHEHDPEGEAQLLEFAPHPIAPEYPLNLNRVAAQSDLLVTIAVTGVPFGGGHAALLLGLGGYPNARALATAGVSDNQRRAAAELGAMLERHVSAFAIELVLDSALLQHEFASLNGNEDDLSTLEQLGLRTVNHLPRRARLEVIARADKHPRLIAVYCGDTSKVGKAALAKYVEQHAIPFTAPADVVVTGLPVNSGLNAVGGSRVGAALNPVLIKYTLESLVLRRNTGVPLLQPGGTVVLLNPCSNRFDHTQHTSFFDFFNTVLPVADERLLAQKEADFLLNPALLAVFRSGNAYHPTLPFLLWRQTLAQASSESSNAHRVIVVGADNESVPRLLGYETASSVAEALFRARNGGNQAQEVVCLHNPLAVLCHHVEH